MEGQAIKSSLYFSRRSMLVWKYKQKKKGHIDSNTDTSTQTPSCISREKDPFVNKEKKNRSGDKNTRKKQNGHKGWILGRKHIVIPKKKKQRKAEKKMIDVSAGVKKKKMEQRLYREKGEEQIQRNGFRATASGSCHPRTCQSNAADGEKKKNQDGKMMSCLKKKMETKQEKDDPGYKKKAQFHEDSTAKWQYATTTTRKAQRKPPTCVRQKKPP